MNKSIIQIKSILVNCANSAKYCDDIIREEKLEFSAKMFFRNIEGKLLSIERDLCTKLPIEHAEQIKNQISGNWETLAVQNIQTMMMSMNDAQLQIAEAACANIIAGTFKIEME